MGIMACAGPTNAQECEEWDSSDEASEQDGQDRVQHGRPANALDCALLVWYRHALLRLNG
jgi:hypothetical protein